MARPADLPDFHRPPVSEVALGVQFTPLSSMRAAHLGIFWSEIRAEYPILEERAPARAIVEQFGTPRSGGIRLDLSDTPPVPRCWFLSSDRSEVVQLQQDKLVINWRRLAPDAEYPRYENVRERFVRAFETFRSFAVREDLGDLELTQAEVTYVNEVPVGPAWESLGRIQQVLRMWKPEYDPETLGEPEDVRMAQRHLILDEEGSPYARLYISAEPVYSKGQDALMLTVLVRGRPSPDPNKALEFLDMGRDRIVRGFTAVTTEPMHELWERLH